MGAGTHTQGHLPRGLWGLHRNRLQEAPPQPHSGLLAAKRSFTDGSAWGRQGFQTGTCSTWTFLFLCAARGGTAASGTAEMIQHLLGSSGALRLPPEGDSPSQGPSGAPQHHRDKEVLRRLDLHPVPGNSCSSGRCPCPWMIFKSPPTQTISRLCISSLNT